MSQQPLRILYIEDNSLIVFHVETLLEELGHVFAGSVSSFADLKKNFETFEFDGSLVDIDLADGRTGPIAAAWLRDRGIPSIFVTGQDSTAAENASLVLGVISKPIDPADLAAKLPLLAERD